MRQAVLLIGGNLGDRRFLLKQAEDQLAKVFTILQKSKVYESDAWGDNSEGDYLNRVIIIETEMEPDEVLTHAQSIEDMLERQRHRKWGNRTMDIDILYIDQQIINTPRLNVPHPYIQDRKFVLVPLTELMPGYIHPIFGKTHAQLLDECSDKGRVRTYEG